MARLQNVLKSSKCFPLELSPAVPSKATNHLTSRNAKAIANLPKGRYRTSSSQKLHERMRQTRKQQAAAFFKIQLINRLATK
eukprot:scaffold328485_cov37-Prasinocladus_malaysianus.AAC.1